MSQSTDLRTSRQGATSAEPAHGVPGWLIALPAVASGMTVANLYSAQPLLASVHDAPTPRRPPRAY
ncbi:hypothetical protein ACWEWX_46410 [Streptomyces asiaticus]